MEAAIRYRCLFATILVVITTQVMCAQTQVGVSVEQVAGRSGIYDVLYVPPSTTVFGTRAFDDTIFCAALSSTMHGKRGIVQPMLRVDSALYRVRLVLPDSTYSVRLEICLPTERVPNGIMEFAYQSDELPLLSGSAMHILDDLDTALQFERTMYPWNYYAYYQYWEMQRAAFVQTHGGISREQATVKVDSLLQIVLSQRQPTFNWYLTVSRLYANRLAGDSLERLYLDSAVKAQLRDRVYDPLLENETPWNAFFAPELRGEDVLLQTDRSRITLDLAVTYPRSEFGKAWMLRSSGFKDLDTAKVNSIINAWSSSTDVDVLSAIASRLMIAESPIYDPVRAEQLYRRAEQSSVQQLGFRSGENIFGSMGRVDRIRAAMVDAYTAQKRYKDAFALGRQSMLTASNEYGRQVISKSLVASALASGDSVLAESFKHYALPPIGEFSYETIDGKKGRLADHKGKIVVLDFWFIGCGGCAIEHKSLNTFGLQYKDDPRVVFLSMALNDKQTLLNYLERSPLAADVVAKSDAICSKLGVTAYPTHIIIDKEGRTALWEVGGSSKTGEGLSKAVEQLLK